MSTTKQREHSNHFWCDTCDPKSAAEPMTPQQAKEHLASAHRIMESKGTRKGVQFLDGGDGYANTFEWTFKTPDNAEVKMTQVSAGPRVGFIEEE